jgi:hypothetical protein
MCRQLTTSSHEGASSSLPEHAVEQARWLEETPVFGPVELRLLRLAIPAPYTFEVEQPDLKKSLVKFFTMRQFLTRFRRNNFAVAREVSIRAKFFRTRWPY